MRDTLAFLINLPSEIIIDILSRLPIRAIISCKCVCRKLLELISSAPFAELHLSRSSPVLIVHQFESYQVDVCKMYEFDDGLELQHHDLHYIPMMECHWNSIVTSSDSDLWMEGGSVNGLLCLYDGAIDAFYVCNPITRDYIALPAAKDTLRCTDMVMYGFGVSSSGQYKLVRIKHGEVESQGPSSRKFPGFECLIYTLGTDSWRSIAPGVTFELNYGYPSVAFLNGNLHWLVGDSESSSFIACLDLETELFKPFPGHPFPSFFCIRGILGVLGDFLCFSDCSTDDQIVIWVMKEYGVEKSWTKEYIISKDTWELWGLYHDAAYPIKAFKDGDILFFWQRRCLFYYSSKTGTAAEVDLKVNQYVTIQPMLHTPSFLSPRRLLKENVASSSSISGS